MEENKEIELIIKQDYDSYFEAWTKVLIEELEKAGNTLIKSVIVDSGPYRDAGLSFKLTGDVLSLDFYSALRNGFGDIGVTQEEFVKQLTKVNETA